MSELGIEKITPAATSEQELPSEQKALLKEVYERVEIFEQECRQYHDEARVCRDVLRLKDPLQDAEDATETTLQLQTLKSTFNNCVADQMQNMPEARILPEVPDNQALADDLQDAVRYVVYDLNNFQGLQRRRAEDFFGTGTSIVQVVWDETMTRGKGDIALIRWPVESFLWDPQAENIQDARALIKVSWHPLSWYTAHYPDRAAYVNGEDGMYNDIGLPSTQKLSSGTDEPRALLLEYWYRRYDQKSKRYTINVAYCAGGALLDFAEDVYQHGLYPFVMDAHSTIEGVPVGEGLISELTPMMRYINRYARYIDTNLRMSSKGRLLTKRGAGIDMAALSDWSKDMIEGDSIDNGRDWAWLQHAPFNGMIAQQMLQMQSDLKQDSGANQFTRGEAASGVTAAKAIAALQEAGGKIAGLRTDTLNLGFQRMIEQIMWLMAEFYDKDRMLLLTARDGNARLTDVSASRVFKKSGGAVPPPPYMVRVEINKRNPLQVEAQNEMYMQAYTMAAQAKQYFPLSALFRLMNIEGKDRLLPVIEESEKKMQQMEQLQAQAKQLTEQLAAMQQENERLKLMTTQMTNALSNINANTGGNIAARPRGAQAPVAGMAPPVSTDAVPKTASAGGGMDTTAAIVDQSRTKLAKSPV